MGAGNGKPQPRFSIGLIGHADSELQAIGKDAAIAGVGAVVEATYQAILARLRRDPVEFGEPLFHIAKMRMAIRCAVIAPLYVEYGIHDEKPVVVIRRILYLSANIQS